VFFSEFSVEMQLTFRFTFAVDSAGSAICQFVGTREMSHVSDNKMKCGCNRERKCADTILAQCRFHGLAISNAKI